MPRKSTSIPNAYCYRCPFGLTYPKCDCACADYMKDFFGKIAPDMIAALVVEPVQGEGGFITPPKEYFPKLAKICTDNNILFVADEIQSGMGQDRQTDVRHRTLGRGA